MAGSAFADQYDVIGTVKDIKVYGTHCMGARGADGFVAMRGANAGCLIEEGNNRNRIEWEPYNGKSYWNEHVGAVSLRAPQEPVQAAPRNGVPTRADVARSMNQRTYDQFGRPQPSVAEACAQARVAGGPVTKICALNQWAQ